MASAADPGVDKRKNQIPDVISQFVEKTLGMVLESGDLSRSSALMVSEARDRAAKRRSGAPSR